MSETEKCKLCRGEIHTKILEHYLSLQKSLDYSGGVLKNFYFVFIRLLWNGEQPKTVSPEETDYIALLRNTGFSIGDIAFIMGRSKSTVHDVLARTVKLAKATHA